MSKAQDLASAQWMGSAPWGSVTYTSVSVTTSDTALPATALTNRKGLLLSNPSANAATVFIKPSTSVGTTNEYELFAGAVLLLPISDAVTLYGKVAAGTATVIVWEFTV